MPANAIACAACSYPVSAEFWNREEGVRCPGCGHRVRAMVFPAVNSTRTGISPAALEEETEASCFYHPQSRAAQVCEDCGRFLCNLCDLEIDGRHICPRCFDKVETVEPVRPMYDTMALAIATVPALLFWPAIVGAPWALVMVIRRWNAPSSLVPRTKIRFILAALFALTEIGFVIFIIFMMTQLNLRGPRR
jgi:DNA-directed RNA polymerase subunit RPC12/RpoP